MLHCRHDRAARAEDSGEGQLRTARWHESSGNPASRQWISPAERPCCCQATRTTVFGIKQPESLLLRARAKMFQSGPYPVQARWLTLAPLPCAASCVPQPFCSFILPPFKQCRTKTRQKDTLLSPHLGSVPPLLVWCNCLMFVAADTSSEQGFPGLALVFQGQQTSQGCRGAERTQITCSSGKMKQNWRNQETSEIWAVWNVSMGTFKLSKHNIKPIRLCWRLALKKAEHDFKALCGNFPVYTVQCFPCRRVPTQLCLQALCNATGTHEEIPLCSC